MYPDPFQRLLAVATKTAVKQYRVTDPLPPHVAQCDESQHLAYLSSKVGENPIGFGLYMAQCREVLKAAEDMDEVVAALRRLFEIKATDEDLKNHLFDTLLCVFDVQ